MRPISGSSRRPHPTRASRHGATSFPSASACISKTSTCSNVTPCCAVAAAVSAISRSSISIPGRSPRSTSRRTVRTVGANANPEFATETFRFTYTSFVTPATVFDLDMRTHERTLLKATEVPGYEPSLYTTELRHATASDGTRVPISLVLARGRRAHGGDADAALRVRFVRALDGPVVFGRTPRATRPRRYVRDRAHPRRRRTRRSVAHGGGISRQK